MGLKYLRFFLLGIVVFFSSIITIIYCLFSPFNPRNTYFFSHNFIPLILKILGVKISIEGKEYLDPKRPSIYVGNHQNNLDIWIYGYLCVDGGVCVGKNSIKWIPLFGQMFWLTGNILIKRQNKIKSKESMIEAREAILNKGASIYLLPEGTRNRGRGIKEFKKGAFILAADTKAPIVPISINTYSKNGIDYNNLIPCEVKVIVFPPIESANNSEFLREKSFEIIKNGIHHLDSSVS